MDLPPPYATQMQEAEASIPIPRPLLLDTEGMKTDKLLREQLKIEGEGAGKFLSDGQKSHLGRNDFATGDSGNHITDSTKREGTIKFVLRYIAGRGKKPLTEVQKLKDELEARQRSFESQMLNLTAMHDRELATVRSDTGAELTAAINVGATGLRDATAELAAAKLAAAVELTAVKTAAEGALAAAKLAAAVELTAVKTAAEEELAAAKLAAAVELTAVKTAAEVRLVVKDLTHKFELLELKLSMTEQNHKFKLELKQIAFEVELMNPRASQLRRDSPAKPSKG